MKHVCVSICVYNSSKLYENGKYLISVSDKSGATPQSQQIQCTFDSKLPFSYLLVTLLYKYRTY